jgi:septum site-determining protein MinC
MMDGIAKAPRQSFRIRGRSYVALAFCRVVPIVGWLEEIEVTLARSPGVFAGKPDLSAVDLSQSAIAHLITGLQRNIRILGIESVDAARLTTSMPPLLTGEASACSCRTNQSQICCSTAQCAQVSRSLARGCERAGFGRFRRGDCRRRVYPCLCGVRGRAMAGSSDNAAARMFCQKIEAELLAINGYYQTAEEDVALRIVRLRRG